MTRGRRLSASRGAVAACLAALLVGAGTTYGVVALGQADGAGPEPERSVGQPRDRVEEAASPKPVAKQGTPVATPQAETPSAEPEPTPTTEPQRPPQSQRPPESPPEPLWAAGDQGPAVRELQARLKQLEWYAPDVTGVYDRTTVQAVSGFQTKRGFQETGAVDKRTWKRVLSMSRTPTAAELHNRLTPGPTILGPGDSGREVRELQARLKQIAWMSGEVTDYYGEVTTAAVAGFQTKRGILSTGEVDQRTLDRLAAMTSEPTRAELLNLQPEAAAVPPAGAPLDPRCLSGDVMCVDKSSNSLRWVVDGDVQMSMDVRFGSAELPTDEGEFAVSYKSIDHVSSLYGTPMPFAMFFSGGQAVHYSPDFAANGYDGASHGCVNVRDYGAIQSLFDQVDVGDKVVVYWS